MVQMRAQKRKEAFHKPPPHPIPLPLGGGEGARRAGEGVVHGPNACEKRKGAFHEPAPLPACGQPLPPCRERGANLVSASPLLTPPSWGEGIDQRHGGGVLDAPPFAVRSVLDRRF